MIVLKVRAVHGVALNMLRGHLRALGHSEELALGKVDTLDKEDNIFWHSSLIPRTYALERGDCGDSLNVDETECRSYFENHYPDFTLLTILRFCLASTTCLDWPS